MRSGRSSITASAPPSRRSFGDIFFPTALKNGMLPIIQPAAMVAKTARAIWQNPGRQITIDLESQNRRVRRTAPSILRRRSILQALPAQRHRRARIHAVPIDRSSRFRARPHNVMQAPTGSIAPCFIQENKVKIAVLPGDGIGIEVTAQAVKVLTPWSHRRRRRAHRGADRLAGATKRGDPLPPATLDRAQAPTRSCSARPAFRRGSLATDAAGRRACCGCARSSGCSRIIAPA